MTASRKFSTLDDLQCFIMKLCLRAVEFKERWGGGKAGRVNGSKYCCRSIFFVNVFSTLFCMFYISFD